MTFDPVAMCQILTDEGVDFVVVGGFGATIHGSTLLTEDVDIVPSRDQDNLDRLARALTRMNAQIRTSDGAIPAPMDAGFLANMPFMLNLITDHGALDLTYAPSGPLDGFVGWNANATTVSLSDTLSVRVGAIDDIIESKRAAGRPKDTAGVMHLESLREQIAQLDGEDQPGDPR